VHLIKFQIHGLKVKNNLLFTNTMRSSGVVTPTTLNRNMQIRSNC